MRHIALMVLGSCLFAGCSDETPAAEPDEPVCLPQDNAEQAEPLRWKRSDALFADLSDALALDLDTQCLELGEVPCSRAHRVALGGSAPFESALYVPVREPLVITPLVAERVVLASCAARVSADAAMEPDAREVFGELDFESVSLAPGSASIDATTSILYQRLLGRDATAEELSVVRSLATEVDARQFATLACFAVGTSTEFLFF